MRATMLMALVTAPLLLLLLAAPCSCQPVVFREVASYADNFRFGVGVDSSILFVGVAVGASSGLIYVCDSENSRVVVLYRNGSQALSIASGSPAGFIDPNGIAVDAAGLVYVTDDYLNLLIVLFANGTQKANVSVSYVPLGVAVSAAGDVICVAVGYTNSVVVLNRDLSTRLSFSSIGSNDGLSQPTGLALDGAGNLYIGDFNNQRVVQVSVSTGRLKNTIATNVDPLGVAVDPTGVYVFVVDQSHYPPVVNQYYNNGQINAVKAVVTNQVLQPSGLAVDASGRVLVVDSQNNTIDVFSSALPASSSTAFSSSALSSSALSSSPRPSSSTSPPPSSSTSQPSSSKLSSSVVSSSALPSSTVSAVSSSAIPSSTSVGMAYADPRFLGFWGQDMFVGGMAGAVYSLLSDSAVLLNARFVQLAGEDIHCPAVVQMPCSPHSGTYFGAIGVRSSNEDRLTIAAGRDGHGFESVQLNGVELLAGGVVTHHQVSSPSALQRLRGGDRASPSSFAIHAQLLSNRTLQVSVGMYELRVDNLDHYLDLVSVNVTCWQCLLEQVQPEGLLGRTWDRHVQHSVDEQVVDEYRERDGDLLGCNSPRTMCPAENAAASSPRRLVV